MAWYLGWFWLANIAIYDESLQNSFQNWSWGTHQIGSTLQAHGGSHSLFFEPDGWSGIYLQSTQNFSLSAQDALVLWLFGTGAGGQQLSVSLIHYDFSTSSQNVLASANLAAYLPPSGLPAGLWTEVVVPFADLGLSLGTLNGVVIQDASGGNQSAVFLDDLFLREGSGPPPGPDVNVSAFPSQNRRTVDERIYGVSTMDPPPPGAPDYTFLRWGGNTSSRYAYDADAHNVGFDWFYFSYANAHPNPGNLPAGSRADRFVEAALTASSTPLVSLPTLGWVARDRTRRWSFSVAEYGAQQETECSWFPHHGQPEPEWCNEDAGNGLAPDGQPITGNDPQDASKAVGPAYVAAWVQHLMTTFGSGPGSVHHWALDNEPMLWNSTHADVHPDPLGYDGLWQKTLDYGQAIRATDPSAVLFGPVLWGWCAYFASAIDAAEPPSCIDGSDRQAHGGKPLIEWYLEQNAAYAVQHGTRLVDVLDIHYYPQGGQFVFSNSDAEAEFRFRSLRSLWDPSYMDESWIGEPVRLIPRMRSWIEENCPGMELAVTEYNWGGDDSITSALAQVEVLAIFAREGVNYGARWVMPDAGSRVEDSFRLFLNPDGAQTRVSGTSFRVESSAAEEVAAYGIEALDGRLFFILVNRSQLTRTLHLNVPGRAQIVAPVYQFDLGASLHAAAPTQPSATGFDLSVPGWSASLVVVPAACSSSVAAYLALWPEGYAPELDLAPAGNPDGLLNLLDMVMALVCP